MYAGLSFRTKGGQQHRMKMVYDLIRHRSTLEVICGNCDNSRVFNHRFLMTQYGPRHYPDDKDSDWSKIKNDRAAA
jgi:hypothetical protein